MINFIYILISVLQIYYISAFQTLISYRRNRYTYLQQSSESPQTIQLPTDVDFNSLMIMDVVLFQRNDDDNSDTNSKLELGAVQDNGNVAPLSTWTLEASYTSSSGDDILEFVVDEEDTYPGLSANEVIIHKRIDVDYGSRQVGGGKGPGNPHGEESELTYFIDRGVIEGKYCNAESVDDPMTIEIVINTDLEHVW